MEHFANFGYIKQANKQLKNIYELQGKGRNETVYSSLPKSISDLSLKVEKDIPVYNTRAGQILDGQKRQSRQGRKDKKDPLSIPYSKGRFPKYGEQTYDGFTDVRQVSDGALSRTGYAGFRTDPYKGYGGMMEEEVPRSAINKKDIIGISPLAITYRDGKPRIARWG